MAKMELSCAAGDPLAKIFSPRSCLGLLLLAVAQILLANGQQGRSKVIMRYAIENWDSPNGNVDRRPSYDNNYYMIFRYIQLVSL